MVTGVCEGNTGPLRDAAADGDRKPYMGGSMDGKAAGGITVGGPYPADGIMGGTGGYMEYGGYAWEVNGGEAEKVEGG